jgi:hypothetical protein
MAVIIASRAIECEIIFFCPKPFLRGVCFFINQSIMGDLVRLAGCVQDRMDNFETMIQQLRYRANGQSLLDARLAGVEARISELAKQVEEGRAPPAAVPVVAAVPAAAAGIEIVPVDIARGVEPLDESGAVVPIKKRKHHHHVHDWPDIDLPSVNVGDRATSNGKLYEVAKVRCKGKSVRKIWKLCTVSDVSK